ncbi:MAG: pyridoxamine 5'-phosphate oxidase family protein, partial [Chloroflexi bacterium]|nr:pyridoxamine 5'-phosphate oxidase family protein [Chloroflexota bacterium]
MTLQLTGAQVWQELGQEIFAVLGMVSASGEARTAGVVYIVHDRKLYIATKKTAWKARHIQNNPHVSITVPIARHVPFMPWIRIPAATITFSGTARVLDA